MWWTASNELWLQSGSVFVLPAFFLISLAAPDLFVLRSFFSWKHKNTHDTEFTTPGENRIDRVPARRNCGAKLGRTETDAAQ